MAEAEIDDQYEPDSGDEDDEVQEAQTLFQVRVVFPFDSSCDVELTIKKGDVINVSRQDVGGGWWEGELNGVRGLFPEKYTERIVDAPAAAVAPSVTMRVPVPQPRNINSGDRNSELRSSEARNSDSRGSEARAAESFSAKQIPSRNPMLPGPKWEVTSDPFVIAVKANAKKGSKYSGIKQFTTYEVCNTVGVVIILHLSMQSTGMSVTRRFKHFTWLHARLAGLFPFILIPAIPEKQIQGRFEENFIETRRRKLQRFISRVAEHPVLGPSSVFLHFLSASDQKTWKKGKRSAEHEATSAFLEQIVTPGERPVDTDHIIGTFSRFFGWVDRQLHQLGKVLDEISTLQLAESSEFSKAANVLARFNDTIPATAKFEKGDIKPKYNEWWADGAGLMEDLLGAFNRLGSGFVRVVAHESEFQDQERQRFHDLIREYLAMMKNFSAIVKMHDTAWHDFNAASMKESTTPEQRSTMHTRCNIISSVVLSEFQHFHQNTVRDFREALRQYANGRVEHYRQAQETWQQIADSVA